MAKEALWAKDDGPEMPPLEASKITDEGYLALVKAIVSRASHDVTHFKAGTQIRVQAEQFFESDYFTALTGLDGKAILRDLREKGKKKGPDKRGRKPGRGFPRKVRCIETGVVYADLKTAAQATNCHRSCIQEVCTNRRSKAGGLHWEYVKEGDD